MKKQLKQATKSKTIDFNVLAGTSIGILALFGVTPPGWVLGVAIPVVNIILRYLTKVPMSEK